MLEAVQLIQVRILSVLAGAVVVAGCADTSGFSGLIEQANIEQGRLAFIDHRCHQCHNVTGVSLPALAGASPPMLELGGEIIAVKSYAELMTSIINPNHVISERYREQLRVDTSVPGESPMPMPHIERMSVRQLIDLVAFLDSRYVLIEEYESGI
jgi:sulfur-oxidizing protein SoxX